jgi:hypothetical protein
MKTEITQEEVKAVLHYNPDTGVFTYKHGPRIGCAAGTKNVCRYLVININKNVYLLHRLAWLCMNGVYPPKGMVIDHKNGKRNDNRWCNLRLATRRQNQQNRIGANKSGYKGVDVVAATGKFTASIKYCGKRIYLGTFQTKEEAAAAYDAKANELFGEYARESRMVHPDETL